MSGCRIFIGRLSPSAREKDVERFFKGYGRIRDIDLKKGFGFVVSHLTRRHSWRTIYHSQTGHHQLTHTQVMQPSSLVALGSHAFLVF